LNPFIPILYPEAPLNINVCGTPADYQIHLLERSASEHNRRHMKRRQRQREKEEQPSESCKSQMSIKLPSKANVCFLCSKNLAEGEFIRHVGSKEHTDTFL
jgi:hypothetical protein